MDHVVSLRLAIETARKSEDWAQRCGAYKMAIDYFYLLEPDSYELCSYGKYIPEFIQEECEYGLRKALSAVKLFVSRCVEAPSIAGPLTRAIIEKLFFRASTEVRVEATEIILDLIEWKACDAVLKELISGALKNDGVRSDECLRVMRYALLNYGPRVINIHKLVDVIAELVGNKSFLTSDDECFRLLIIIYKCLGPEAQGHLMQILDPHYISAIEDGYEDMMDIPDYLCRLERYSRDNSSPIGETDGEMFPVCSPSNNGNEDMFTEREGMEFEPEHVRFRDFGRGPYLRGGDAGPLGNENKGYWSPKRCGYMANLAVDYEAAEAYECQRNYILLNGYNNDGSYDVFDNCDRPNNFVKFPEKIRPFCAEDKASQTDGFSVRSSNPFEVIIQKLIDKYGTFNILDWLWLKLNSNQERKVHEKRTEESRTFHLLRKCKSLESLAANKEHIQNEARCSFSDTTVCRVFSGSLSACSDSSEKSGGLINLMKIKRKDNIIAKKASFSVTKQHTTIPQVLEKQTENLTEVPVVAFESIALSQECIQNSIKQGKKENVPVFIENRSEYCSKNNGFVLNFFGKIILIFLKKDETAIKRSLHQNGPYLNTFYPFMADSQQLYYFHQETRMNIQSEMKNSCLYIDDIYTQRGHKTYENCKDIAEERYYAGPTLERRNEKNSFGLTSEGNPTGVMSFRHRGCGDDFSQTELEKQEDGETPALDEEKPSG